MVPDLLPHKDGLSQQRLGLIPLAKPVVKAGQVCLCARRHPDVADLFPDGKGLTRAGHRFGQLAGPVVHRCQEVVSARNYPQV